MLSGLELFKKQQAERQAKAEQKKAEPQEKSFKDLSLDEQRKIISSLESASRERNLDREIHNSREYVRFADEAKSAEIRESHRKQELREIRKEKEGLSFYQMGKKKELEQREAIALEEVKKATFEAQLKKEELHLP